MHPGSSQSTSLLTYKQIHPRYFLPFSGGLTLTRARKNSGILMTHALCRLRHQAAESPRQQFRGGSLHHPATTLPIQASNQNPEDWPAQSPHFEASLFARSATTGIQRIDREILFPSISAETCIQKY